MKAEQAVPDTVFMATFIPTTVFHILYRLVFCSIFEGDLHVSNSQMTMFLTYYLFFSIKCTLTVALGYKQNLS